MLSVTDRMAVAQKKADEHNQNRQVQAPQKSMKRSYDRGLGG